LKIAVVLGTRPEIIKMSPVIRALGALDVKRLALDVKRHVLDVKRSALDEAPNTSNLEPQTSHVSHQTSNAEPQTSHVSRQTSNYFIIHTGQHYSYNMDKVFFEQLKLPAAKYNLEAGSGSHGEQTAKILAGIEKVFLTEKPDVILVEGDTNTVLAGALAASKLYIKVGHVEAGLRSYDRQMPEEINRVLTDHISDYLFAPTEKSRAILISEGIPDNKIFVTGNTIVDAVYQNLEIAKNHGNILDSLKLQPQQYFLATIHRQENVDNLSRFSGILEALKLLTAKYQLPVIYPIHPRARKMMTEFKLMSLDVISKTLDGETSNSGEKSNVKRQTYNSPGLHLIDPVDYFGFLQLEKEARLILTDSGGVQEESCILGTPCVTLRDNTERPETLEVGASILAGTDLKKILESCEALLNNDNDWKNPFGDGKAGERIISIISGGNNV
jgi:UDP-N-acetylglucosamine 2-epimerase (non-hydrolysing)